MVPKVTSSNRYCGGANEKRKCIKVMGQWGRRDHYDMILINVVGGVVTVENGKIGCLIHRQTGEREHKISNNRPNSNSNSNYVLKSQPFKIFSNTKNNQKILHKSGGLPPPCAPLSVSVTAFLQRNRTPNTLYNNNLSETTSATEFLWIYIYIFFSL